MKIRLTAGTLVAAFMMVVALTAAPRQHEEIHHVNGEHECAVTLFAAGKCDHAGPVEIRTEGVLLSGMAVPAFRPAAVPFARLETFILEHAPPVAG